MSILQNITSPVWSLSINAFGSIVQGLTAIRQRIHIALTTTKGTDPMRPLFGSDIFKYQDAPINVAVVEIKREILLSLQKWVPDITNIKVTYSIKDENAIFNIAYGLTNSEILDSVQYELANGTITNVTTQGLTLQALFPSNPNSYPFQIDLSLNNQVTNPAPPANGFETVELMFDWVRSNWNFLASWLLQPNQLIAYVADPKYTTGKLLISLLEIFKVSTSIPVLNPGERWVVRFQPESTAENYLADTPFYTLGDLVTGMQVQFGLYGSWNLEAIGGDFNGDFNGDFSVASTKLVFMTRDYKNAVITITKE